MGSTRRDIATERVSILARPSVRRGI